MEDRNIRIKITVGEATIEIEGSEAYVDKKLADPGTFNALTKQISDWATPPVPAYTKNEIKEPTNKKPKEARKRKVVKGPESYSLVHDLDLAKAGNIPSLKEFYEEKQPSSAQESNAVFIYYLKKLKHIQNIGIEHVYTCYKGVGAKVPARLYQSLIDTRRTKGWIVTDDISDIGIGTLGENFVESELPNTEKST